jgi:hypothetical protein
VGSAASSGGSRNKHTISLTFHMAESWGGVVAQPSPSLPPVGGALQKSRSYTRLDLKHLTSRGGKFT